MKSLTPVRFQQYGRSYHLRIETAQDLGAAVDLDEALWVATSAPVSTLRCDPTMLKLLDRDQDGRIHVSDLKAAIRWLLLHLKDTSGVPEKSDELSLSAIQTEQEQGQRMVTAARKMLARLDQPDVDRISLKQIRQIKSQVANLPVSEGGVVLPEAAEKKPVEEFLKDICRVIGSVPHPSGQEGVNEEGLERFLVGAAEYLDWCKRGEPLDLEARKKLLPVGEKTPEVFSLLAQLRPKIDQYFAQCQLLTQNATWSDRLPPRQEDLQAVDLRSPSAISEFLGDAPVARLRTEAMLDLSGPLNPRFEGQLQSLAESLQDLLPGKQIRVEQWQRIKKHFAPFEEWLKSRPPEPFESLGEEKLREYLKPEYAKAVQHLINQSQETALQMDNIRLAEKLVLFQAYLIDFANNFISFPYLYDPKGTANFELGTLVMDGRRFTFAMPVEKRAEHVKVGESSNLFILYVQVAAEKPFEVAIPVTSGGRGNLMPGKRGVFTDITGQEWDAQVVQIVENPISLSEAIVEPFRRLGRVITGKIEQMTTAAGKQLDSATQRAVTDIQAQPETAVQPPPVTAGSRGLLAGGLLAGGGVALAALGSALAYISNLVLNHGPMILIGGIGGALVAVMLPTTILAMMKLRQRDLSAILEGSGWAINARMRLSRAQSRYFTQKPTYPAGAKGIKRRWIRIVIVILCLLLLGGISGGIYRALKTDQTSAPVKQTAPTEAGAEK